MLSLKKLNKILIPFELTINPKLFHESLQSLLHDRASSPGFITLLKSLTRRASVVRQINSMHKCS